MKIKEAAQVCGLTEKAIRLYEAKGLITPQSEEKNGRTFREYDEKTVRTLMTVGILRRADFTLEQIGAMLSEPGRIGQVFAVHKEEIKENGARLAALNEIVEQLDEDDLYDIHRFADTLAAAMMPGQLLSAEGDGTNADVPSASGFRPQVWDEELTKEEKEAAYQDFMKKQEQRDRISDAVLMIPRKIGAGVRWMKARTDRILRDGQGKVKKSAKTLIAFLCVVVILGAGLLSAVGKLHAIEDRCARGIYSAMHDVVYVLRETLETEEYTYGQCEEVCRNLALMDGYVHTADDIYYHAFNKISRKGWEIGDLVKAMGCNYTGSINLHRAEAILYDGVLSEKELEFIRLLYADLGEIYAIMLAEDGLNCRADLDYELIRRAIHEFFEKWGEWSDMNYDTPYALLKRD